jgi:hypothetical protein
MKIKLLLILPILFSSVHSEILDDATKKAFAEHFRTLVELRKEFPNDLGVDVVFVDLNGDGRLDSIASSKGTKYQDGWDWIVFLRDKDGKWILSDFPETDDPEKQGIFAYPDEFYLYKGKDKPAHVMIMRLVWESDPLITGKPKESEYSAMWLEFDAKLDKMLLKDMPVPTEKELKNYEQLKDEVFGE